MTAYGGVPFTYDSLGNPLTYYNGNQYTFTWAKGRQLTNVTKGSNSFAFTYDAEGRRTSKVSYSNRTVYYVWDGDRLIGEYVPYESTYIYLYDAEGSVIGFKYKDETGYYTGGAFYTYYYEKNLQGDIVGIIDENGNKFVEYTYDAWGNMLSRTMLGSNLWSLHYNLAESNPFLYRGYYYDRETGFYYLRSRYYDPVTGRFINADGYVNANGDLIGYNMYAYCSNNPVMNVDPDGESILGALFVIGSLIGVGIALAFGDAVGGFLNEAIKTSNYKLNSQHEGTSRDSGVIDNQKDFKDYKYGAGFNMSYNGCEVIAVHNALVLTGYDSSLTQVATVFQDNNAMEWLGLFGSAPRRIGDVLTSMEVKYTTIHSVNSMVLNGVYIISYWTSGFPHQIHTVAVQVVNGTPVSYNKTGSATPFEYTSNGKFFIIGYYLGGDYT